MQAFFPSCEQVDFPELKGKPVAVTNGDAGTTIISSSYEARAFGIKTGMHLNEAKQLCPDIVQRPSRPDRYTEISARIMNGLRNVTPDIEVASIDECFMDLEPVLQLYGSVEKIAEIIRQNVLENSNGIVCSIGISEGKLTAKFCAGLNKGKTTIVPPKEIRAYMAPHNLSRITGIGPSLLKHLNSLGYFKCGDMAHAPYDLLTSIKGNTGFRIHLTCIGRDPEPVKLDIEKPKSMGHSKVLPPATTDREKVVGVMHQLSNRLTRRLRENGFISNSVHIFLTTKYETIKAIYKFEYATNNSRDYIEKVNEHLELWKQQPLFKVGLECKKLMDKDEGQQDMFVGVSQTSTIDEIKDEINQKFGKNICRTASEMYADDMNMVQVIAFNFDATDKKKNSL